MHALKIDVTLFLSRRSIIDTFFIREIPVREHSFSLCTSDKYHRWYRVNCDISRAFLSTCCKMTVTRIVCKCTCKVSSPYRCLFRFKKFLQILRLLQFQNRRKRTTRFTRVCINCSMFRTKIVPFPVACKLVLVFVSFRFFFSRKRYLRKISFRNSSSVAVE